MEIIDIYLNNLTTEVDMIITELYSICKHIGLDEHKINFVNVAVFIYTQNHIDKLLLSQDEMTLLKKYYRIIEII